MNQAIKFSGFQFRTDQNVLKRVLVKSISYNKDGVQIVVLAGTTILVDMDRQIALVPGGDHVELSADEHGTMYLL